MDERSIKSWWQRRLPDVSAAVSRFPLAVAIAAVLTAYKLYHGSLIGDVEFRVMAWLAALVPLGRLRSIFTRRANGDRRRRAVCSGCSASRCSALLLWLDTAIWLNAWLLVGSLILALTLAGHLGRRETNETLLAVQPSPLAWRVARWRRRRTARHRTLRHSRDASSCCSASPCLRIAHEYIWTVCLGFVAPVSFLAFAPRRFADPITEASGRTSPCAPRPRW